MVGAADREREKRLTGHGPAIAEAHLKAEAAQASADDALIITESYTQQAYELSVQAEVATAAAEEARLVGATAIAENMLRLLKTELVVSGTQTLTSASYGRMHSCIGSGTYTLTLPPASGYQGEPMGFRLPSAATFAKLDPNGSETIDGLTSLALSGIDAVILVSDGGSNWSRVVGSQRSVRRLVYAPTADLEAATSLTANVWRSLGAQQTFTVSGTNSELVVSLGGFAQAVGVAGGAAYVGSAFLLDGTTRTLVSGNIVPASSWDNFFSGATSREVTGLAAGSHTIQAQVFANTTGVQLYCRPTSQTPEHLYLSVVEHRG